MYEYEVRIMENKFIYVTEDIFYNDTIIKKNEIGIVEGTQNENVIVAFVTQDNPIPVSKEIVKYFDPFLTGDSFEYKICNRCNRLLRTELFDKNQNGKNNRSVRRPSCVDCRKEIDGKALSMKDKQEWEKIKPKYIVWQCPVCKKKTIPGITSKVVLDHNHITGKPRAWICDSCNTGLGRFKDDIETMKDAIEYLEKYDNKT